MNEGKSQILVGDKAAAKRRSRKSVQQQQLNLFG